MYTKVPDVFCTYACAFTAADAEVFLACEKIEDALANAQQTHFILFTIASYAYLKHGNGLFV
jgi:hypothetical protein